MPLWGHRIRVELREVRDSEMLALHTCEYIQKRSGGRFDTVTTTEERTRGRKGKPRKEKETERRKKTQQKVEQMSARRPCCVGFICVLVYLVGGVAATAAVTAVGHRPLLWQRPCHFLCRCPDGVAVQRFCWSVKHHVSESVGCVRGCGFGSGPRTGKASMCQGYCEISR